jgi:hypothetical protein
MENGEEVMRTRGEGRKGVVLYYLTLDWIIGEERGEDERMN